MLIYLKNLIPSKIKFYFSNLYFNFICYFRRDIGSNSYIDKSTHVIGWSSILIGNNSVISQNSWININHRIKGYKSLIIGDNCYIGRRNFFSSGKQITVGNYFMSGLDCKFLGANHGITDPLKPYLSTEVTNDGEIIIGDNVWFGTSVTVLGRVTIGRGSIIGASSTVTKDVPPFSVVVGSPAKVIKRYNFKDKCWVKMEDFLDLYDKFIPSKSEYLSELKKTKLTVPLHPASKRFGDI